MSEKPPFSLSKLDLENFNDFVPPPRFGKTSFDSFKPQHESQELAVAALRDFLKAREPSFRWPWQSSQISRPGLYLDGGFGVGKTHLLAASFYAFEGKKIYLSFSELLYLIGILGRVESARALGSFELYCIDEFELDDPGNTLIVKSFLEILFANNAKVITTSNTIPEAQGRGRFNADDFEREIQGIAKNFQLFSIDGPDYRKRRQVANLPDSAELTSFARYNSDKSLLVLTWQELFKLLRDNHPINYRNLLSGIDLLLLSGASPIALQADALRFVHFIDKLYDLKIGFKMSGNVGLEELFDESYVNSAYATKHYRCLSRISELLEE